MSFSNFQNFDASDFRTRKDDQLEKSAIATFQKCQHHSLGRVVVKVFRQRTSSSGHHSFDEEYQGYEIMLREIDRRKKINHKNIGRFYGVTKWPGFAGIVTECPECGNLAQLLRATKLAPIFPWWLRHRILTEVFEALQYLHNQPIPIVHGNLTSCSILLTEDLTVKLSDFKKINVDACGQDVLNRDEFQLLRLVTPEDLKLLDIYCASQVAYEIITRYLLTQIEFAFLASLDQPILTFSPAELGDELSKSIPVSSIIILLKKVALKCANINKDGRPDADTILEMLNETEINLSGTKKLKQASGIAKRLHKVKHAADCDEPLDVLFCLNHIGENIGTEWTSTPKMEDVSRQSILGVSTPPMASLSGESPDKNEQNITFFSQDDPHLLNFENETSLQVEEEDVNLTGNSINCSTLSSNESKLNKSFDEIALEADKVASSNTPLNALQKVNTPTKGDSNLVNTSIQRCWSLPVEIRFVYETCAIVGNEGGIINVSDCKITIPQGALSNKNEFKFTLLFGREHFQNPNVLVLTPTLSCSPSHNFSKLATVELPTCYAAEENISVTVQESKNGRLWDDLEEVMDSYRNSVMFETTSLSWHRVVSKVPDLIGSFKKTLVYLCYRHPSNCSDPYVTLELRDNVMNPLVSLGETEGFCGVVEVRSDDDLLLKISSPNIIVQPDEKIVMSKDIFEQGFLLQQNFRISKKEEQYYHRQEYFKFEIKRKSSDKALFANSFAFPKILSPNRLAEITLSHCTIPNVSAPATGRRGDHVPRDQNKSEQTDGEEMLGPLAIDSSQDQAVYDQSEVNFITSDLAVKLQNFCKHLGV
ncbi:uncharacterized protein LOC143451619 [Clavelina lepadiformis]|uniref:uncharacterized protein LOC143451619 n=1 Tax=Clavelina lepadiformis TaxID=159417 RepID=UPI004041EB39